MKEKDGRAGMNTPELVQMSMEDSRRAWETRCEPKFVKQSDLKVYKVENN